MLQFEQRGYSLVIGTPISETALATATVGTVFDMAQLASVASTPTLSNDYKFPYFSRMFASGGTSVQLMMDTLQHYSSIAGMGWDRVGLLSSVSEETISLAEIFIERAEENGIEVRTHQSFIIDELDYSVELSELERSKARVFIGMILIDWEFIIDSAAEFGLVGDQYVWFCSASVLSIPFSEPSENTRGAIGVFEHSEERTSLAKLFTEVWRAADPVEFPTAGPGTTPISLARYAFDMVITVARAMQILDDQGLLAVRPTAALWSSAIRNVTFDGASGIVRFTETGDRRGSYDLLNYTPENGTWNVVAEWRDDEGFLSWIDPIWHSNTTEIPDLDIRDPFDYWSCYDAEERTDETGKTITLHTPGSKNVDEIDADYHCDRFIDCQNLSDESVNCSANFTIVFIVFGVITGILILQALMLLLFVIVFGYILKYRRVRHASPFFLIVILLSIIVGFSSIYAWFGKPHPVACGFQPWLLGLPAIAMIAALAVKNFRVWRIFRFPLIQTTITNSELFIYWSICMLPALFIVTLWTIISTPTAKLQDFSGEEHYVCATGGFTGEPGGIVFFSILVAYSTIVLIIGAVVSVLSRNAPSRFNESKILTVSIYNILFLAIVGIPVFLIVKPYDPFIAWVLRSVAILYAFGATMYIQFIPILIGIFIVDKGKNILGPISLGTSSRSDTVSPNPLSLSS